MFLPKPAPSSQIITFSFDQNFYVKRVCKIKQTADYVAYLITVSNILSLLHTNSIAVEGWSEHSHMFQIFLLSMFLQIKSAEKVYYGCC